eukprot:COSAG06_NODE_23693_length_684_cov_0.658120_1_plen_38_part_10
MPQDSRGVTCECRLRAAGKVDLPSLAHPQLPSFDDDEQ